MFLQKRTCIFSACLIAALSIPAFGQSTSGEAAAAFFGAVARCADAGTPIMEAASAIRRSFRAVMTLRFYQRAGRTSGRRPGARRGRQLELHRLLVLGRLMPPAQLGLNAASQRVLGCRLAVHDKGLLRRRREVTQPAHDLVRVGVG